MKGYPRPGKGMSMLTRSSGYGVVWSRSAVVLWLAVMLSTAACPQQRLRIIKVHDGDTLTGVDSVHVTHKLRLLGIDCPEYPQPYGEEAAKTVQKLCLHDTVRVFTSKRDRYGRELCTIRLNDGTELNRRLLSLGLAWWFSRYSPNNKEYKALEVPARRNRVGLWSQPDPMPPWIYRDSRRK
jgi:endonuclease YncB( thermonuclease family)